MKKLLGIIVLGLMLSGNAYANDTIKLGMSFYELRIIDKQKAYYPLKKTSKRYLYGTTMINDKRVYLGFEYDGAKKTQVLGKKLYKKYKLVKIFETSLERYNYYLDIPNIHRKDKAKLLKYKNMILDRQKKILEDKKRAEAEKANALTQEKAIKNHLSNRKLEKAEGIWVTNGGSIFVIYKNKGEYFSKIIRSQYSKSGETFAENFTSGATNTFNGDIKCRSTTRSNIRCKINFVAYEYNLKGSFNYPDWLTRQDWQGPTFVDFSWSRAWPDDFVAYNKKFRSEDDLEREQKDLALIVNDVKKTCSVLGFEEGSEKFADCTLKLYSQKIDEMVTEKQARNQQLIQSQQSNTTTTQSSSGTNTTIIYDPVRDRQNQIDKGMKMLSGKCTLGVDC